jgi:hypothetical protein
LQDKEPTPDNKSLEPEPEQNKNTVYIRPKTPEEKFEEENNCKLNEEFFNALNDEQKATYITKLVNSKIEDITVYTFIYDFIEKEDNIDFISDEYLIKNQNRL